MRSQSCGPPCLEVTCKRVSLHCRFARLGLLAGSPGWSLCQLSACKLDCQLLADVQHGCQVAYLKVLCEQGVNRLCIVYSCMAVVWRQLLTNEVSRQSGACMGSMLPTCSVWTPSQA